MSMTLQEQAWQSGLVLFDETEEWNENDWPPLKGGWRSFHTSVVLNHTDKDNDSNNWGQTVVVLGGYKQDQAATNSVLVMNVEGQNKQWREGPPMNQKRYEHAAVKCNGAVYVMGGYNRVRGYLDCIEQIDANDLLQSTLTASNKHERHWTTLNCRLSTGRGCCAVAVHNRYIIVVGGYYNDRCLSSVDIIDASNHTVIAGPSMAVPRQLCSSAVVSHHIFVVGGWRRKRAWRS